MTHRILIFPAGQAEAEAFAATARAAGHHLVGASSLRNDPARAAFEAWVPLPYVHEPAFESALTDVLAAHGITAVFSAHILVRHRLSLLLPRISPGVALLDDLQPTRHAGMAHAAFLALARSLDADSDAQLRPVELAAVLQRALQMRGESGATKLACLLALGQLLPQGDVLEIGALAGRSAFVLGWLARRYGVGPVLIMDPWEKEDALQHDAPKSLQDSTLSLDFRVFRDEFLENLVPCFHATLNYLRERAGTIRARYGAGMQVGPTEFGTTRYIGAAALLHIDGNHDFAAVSADVADWTPLVLPGGWVAVDDYVWTFGDGPRRAGNALLETGDWDRAFVCDGALFLRRRPSWYRTADGA